MTGPDPVSEIPPVTAEVENSLGGGAARARSEAGGFASDASAHDSPHK